MVYATVAASVVCFVLLRSRAVLLLLLVEAGTGGDRCGAVQLGPPIWLVALHLLAGWPLRRPPTCLFSVSRRAVT